jgi:glycosyltransferase involved in cell wall biosynthesis
MSDLSQFVSELNAIITPKGTDGSSGPPSGTSGGLQGVTLTKKLKLLFVSTHINQINGYSKVAYHILQQLSKLDWLTVVHFGTQRMTSADIGRTVAIKQIDGSALDKSGAAAGGTAAGFAFSELAGVIQQEKPNVVLIYNDLAVINLYVESIRKAFETRSFALWAYVDLTYTAPPQGLIDVLNRDCQRVFCFTAGWKAALKAQGITRPVDVLPHGVDTAVFRPVSKDLARQQLGLPKDVFLFTSLNKNIPRKRLDLLVISFVKLIIRFPLKNIFMLLVTNQNDATAGGYPLFEIYARELKVHGVTVDMYGSRLLITNKDTCHRDEDVNLLYNCGDAHVSCAEGEGFGLCSFESMACGVPQIVPELGGYTEYCTRENSLMVKPAMRCYLPLGMGVTGEAQLVNPEEVSKAMERYVFDEDVRKLHGRLGRERCVANTWDSVVAPLVKRLKAQMEEED